MHGSGLKKYMSDINHSRYFFLIFFIADLVFANCFKNLKHWLNCHPIATPEKITLKRDRTAEH
jgi:hypothetical protein